LLQLDFSDVSLAAIYADGGASLLNPEVPGELQLTWFFLSVFIRVYPWPKCLYVLATDEHR
jgi:hypothetical protein